MWCQYIVSSTFSQYFPFLLLASPSADQYYLACERGDLIHQLVCIPSGMEHLAGQSESLHCAITNRKG